MSQLQNSCQKLNCHIFVYLLDDIQIQKLPVNLKASSDYTQRVNCSLSLKRLPSLESHLLGKCVDRKPESLRVIYCLSEAMINI